MIKDNIRGLLAPQAEREEAHKEDDLWGGERGESRDRRKTEMSQKKHIGIMDESKMSRKREKGTRKSKETAENP